MTKELATEITVTFSIPEKIADLDEFMIGRIETIARDILVQSESVFVKIEDHNGVVFQRRIRREVTS